MVRGCTAGSDCYMESDIVEEHCESPTKHLDCNRYIDQINIDNPKMNEGQNIMRGIVIAIATLFILNIFTILLSLDVNLAREWGYMVITIFIGIIITAIVAGKV